MFEGYSHEKEMDTVAREEFDGYEENLAHYEALLETGGNMEEYLVEVV